ncbi:hypothetical protein AB205_0131320 [Aquarana catesbeiana]|uniref:Uncharacterized protein n=1 Tax=Aquarana catesbeiana TaxID=8400 RepID=A0A2G9S415_AQUCT|nr:hypothetical protein AB205_0131320 [Aquarana catesbeiana]
MDEKWQIALMLLDTLNARPRQKMVCARSLKWQHEQPCKSENTGRSSAAPSYKQSPRAFWKDQERNKVNSCFCCCTTCHMMPETPAAKGYMHHLYCKCMYSFCFICFTPKHLCRVSG